MTRNRLPDRRQSLTRTLTWQGRRFAVSFSRFGRMGTGAPAEIFISGTKPASDITAMASDAALIVSIALQYGAPLDVIRNAVGREENGAPQSIVGIAIDAFAEELAS